MLKNICPLICISIASIMSHGCSSANKDTYTQVQEYCSSKTNTNIQMPQVVPSDGVGGRDTHASSPQPEQQQSFSDCMYEHWNEDSQTENN